MLGSLVYQSLLNQLRKDKRGLAISVDEFNTFSTLVDKRILSAYCSRFEEDIDSTSDLGFLKVVGFNIPLTLGVGALPTNYYRMIGDPYYTDTALIPDRPVFVDVVTSKEFTYRQRDYLTRATTRYPICTLGTQNASRVTQIRVNPTTIASVKIDYLRDTDTPFLDYYVNDTTLTTTYLTAGQSVTIATGSTYRDGTTGLKTSATVDWEWDISDLPLILTYFMDAMGIAIPDNLLLQAGLKDREELLNE